MLVARLRDDLVVFVKSHKTGSTSVEMFLEATFFGGGREEKQDFKVYRNGFVTGRPKSHINVANALRAGRSVGLVSRSLHLQRLQNHTPPSRIAQALGSRTFEGASKISVVRNPFDIEASHYFFTRQNVQPPTRSDFREFLESNVRARVNAELGTLGCSGWTYVRLEQIDSDLQSLFRRFGSEGTKMPSVPHRKKNQNGGPEYRSLYDRSSRTIVENRWADWLEKFDYFF